MEKLLIITWLGLGLAAPAAGGAELLSLNIQERSSARSGVILSAGRQFGRDWAFAAWVRHWNSGEFRVIYAMHAGQATDFLPAGKAFSLSSLQELLLSETSGKERLQKIGIWMDEDLLQSSIRACKLFETHQQDTRTPIRPVQVLEKAAASIGMNRPAGAHPYRTAETYLQALWAYADHAYYVPGSAASYSGQLFRNQPHGRGRLSLQESVYLGEFRFGRLHGEGWMQEAEARALATWASGNAQAWRQFQSPAGTLEGSLDPRGVGWVRVMDADSNQYEGDLVEGLPDGEGILRYASGDEYSGQWQAGKWHGQGRLATSARSIFSGRFEGGELAGAGKIELPSGVIYSGGVSGWQPDGEGTMAYPTGETYMGGFRQGKRHGQGTLRFADGSKFSGAFESDRIGGKGLLEQADGTVFQGELLDGKPHGEGTLQFPSGRLKFTGRFKAGKPHGPGVYEYPDGSRYEGAVLDGLPEGGGTYTRLEGRYSGAFRDGWMHGAGSLTFKDGASYSGTFRLGKPEGAGTYTFSDKAQLLITWEEGRLHGPGTFLPPKGEKTALLFKLGALVQPHPPADELKARIQELSRLPFPDPAEATSSRPQ